jgi:hypothetical protein
MGYYSSFKAVFDALKAAVETKDSVKTVVLGEQLLMLNLHRLDRQLWES